ncbi:MAG: hypothetical protein ACYSUT_09170 [Planctomycetota bacterium]|jgi:hypothetical protein
MSSLGEKYSSVSLTCLDGDVIETSCPFKDLAKFNGFQESFFFKILSFILPVPANKRFCFTTEQLAKRVEYVRGHDE